MYPKSNCHEDKASDVAFIHDVIRSELYTHTSVWDASPGYPFQIVYPTLLDLVDSEPSALITLTLLLILRWGLTPHSQVRLMTAAELFEAKLTFLVRLFVKQEPHPVQKALDGRWRLVSSVPSHVNVAARVLLGPQHRLNIRSCDYISPSIGLGLSDPMIQTHIRKAAMVEDSFGLVSSDQSGFDWRFYLLWADVIAQVWVNLTCATGFWENAIRNYCYTMVFSYYVLSDGRIFGLLIPAARKSGDLDTGSGNSLHRIALNITIRLWLKLERPSLVNRSVLPAMTMGDDCCESFGTRVDGPTLVEMFRQLGFKLTDVVIGSRNRFEFCSTRFEYDGSWTITPLSWPRMLFRLLSQEPKQEFLDQFKYELRNLTGVYGGVNLRMLCLFLDRVGWKVPFDSPTNL